jgi:hypothetical protein
MRHFRRPLLRRDRIGLPLQEIADIAHMPIATLTALLEHHGYIETVPYGGQQRRRLVTDQAFYAEFGHNVDGGAARIAHLEGHNRASVFPVFYPEVVSAILWTLDLEGIAAHAASITNKHQRLQWLLGAHSYLPNAEIARLGGCSRGGVEKARARLSGAQEAGAGEVSIPLAGVRFSLADYAREYLRARNVPREAANDNTTVPAFVSA